MIVSAVIKCRKWRKQKFFKKREKKKEIGEGCCSVVFHRWNREGERKKEPEKERRKREQKLTESRNKRYLKNY